MTKLPGFALAAVAEAKCTGYLLEPSHPDGQSKAAFFLRHGYRTSHWQELQVALERHPRDNAVSGSRQQTNPDGTVRVHYEVKCAIAMPDGAVACIKTIWAIHAGDRAPRLITAYPA